MSTQGGRRREGPQVESALTRRTPVDDSGIGDSTTVGDLARTENLHGVLRLRGPSWELTSNGSAILVAPDKEARRHAGEGIWRITYSHEGMPSASRILGTVTPADTKRKRRTRRAASDTSVSLRMCPGCMTEKPPEAFKKTRSPKCRACMKKVRKRGQIRRQYHDESSTSVRTISGGLPGSSRRH